MLLAVLLSVLLAVLLALLLVVLLAVLLVVLLAEPSRRISPVSGPVLPQLQAHPPPRCRGVRAVAAQLLPRDS